MLDKEDVAPFNQELQKELNTIRVLLQWGHVGAAKRRTYFLVPKENGPIHEKAAKKGHAGSAGLGSTVAIDLQPIQCDFTPEPTLEPLVFIFRYASLGEQKVLETLPVTKQHVTDWLQAREIIPPAETVLPKLDATRKRARDSTPDIIDVDELETDDDDVVIIKHMVCLLALVPALALRFVPGSRCCNLEQ
jgi:hypothetical protein